LKRVTLNISPFLQKRKGEGEKEKVVGGEAQRGGGKEKSQSPYSLPQRCSLRNKKPAWWPLGMAPFNDRERGRKRIAWEKGGGEKGQIKVETIKMIATGEADDRMTFFKRGEGGKKNETKGRQKKRHRFLKIRPGKRRCPKRLPFGWKGGKEKEGGKKGEGIYPLIEYLNKLSSRVDTREKDRREGKGPRGEKVGAPANFTFINFKRGRDQQQQLIMKGKKGGLRVTGTHNPNWSFTFAQGGKKQTPREKRGKSAIGKNTRVRSSRGKKKKQPREKVLEKRKEGRGRGGISVLPGVCKRGVLTTKNTLCRKKKRERGKRRR